MVSRVLKYLPNGELMGTQALLVIIVESPLEQLYLQLQQDLTFNTSLSSCRHQSIPNSCGKLSNNFMISRHPKVSGM